MTDNLLALLDLAIRLATAVAWIGTTILAAAATAVAGCLAWAVRRIGRGIRRQAVRRAARRRIRARQRAALIAGEGWAADTDAIDAFYAHINAAEDLDTCRDIWARGVAGTREGDPR